MSLQAARSIASWPLLRRTGRPVAEVHISDGFATPAPDPPYDVVVVIDVFRAFTTACLLFARGAADIVCVPDQAEALDIGDSAVAVGELEVGDPAPGVIPNSPTEVAGLDFAAQRVFMFSLNGTRVMHRASSGGLVMAAAAANAGATAEWILAHASGGRIHLIASDPDSPEDYACARYLAGLLQGTQPDRAAAVSEILAARRSHWDRWGKAASREQWAAASADIDVCARVDSYPIAMVADFTGPHPILRTARTPVDEAQR